jgi:ribosomal protein S27AE
MNLDGMSQDRASAIDWSRTDDERPADVPANPVLCPTCQVAMANHGRNRSGSGRWRCRACLKVISVDAQGNIVGRNERPSAEVIAEMVTMRFAGQTYREIGAHYNRTGEWAAKLLRDTPAGNIVTAHPMTVRRLARGGQYSDNRPSHIARRALRPIPNKRTVVGNKSFSVCGGVAPIPHNREREPRACDRCGQWLPLARPANQRRCSYPPCRKGEK